MTTATTGRDAILSLLDLFESDIGHIDLNPQRREIIKYALRLAAKPADEGVREALAARALAYRQNGGMLFAGHTVADDFEACALSTTKAPKP